MTISVNGDELVVDGGVYTEDDLAQYVTRQGNALKFSGSVRIRNNASLVLRDVLFEVGGSNIVVEEGSTFQLGELINNVPTRGCMLYAPNLKLAYGFGSDVVVDGRTKSGSFKAYGSRIYAPCFWGFFGVSSVVDLVGCSVNGFGRATGSGSRVLNTSFDMSDGRYGILAPYGEFDQFSHVSVSSARVNNNHACGLYLNPNFVSEITVRDCVVNTPEFVYCEPGTATLNFIDGSFKSAECYFASGSDCTIVLKRTVHVVIPDKVKIKFATVDGGLEYNHPGGISSVEVEYGRITKGGSRINDAITYTIDGIVDFLPVGDIMVLCDRRGGPELIC